MVGIYRITTPTGRIYIGQSWDIEKRLKAYKTYKCTSQVAIYRSLIKYKAKNHKFEVIHELPEDVSQDILDEYEKFYISSYRESGLDLINIREGGNGGGKGCKLTSEQRDNLSNKMKGNKNSLGNKNALGSKRTLEHKTERSNLWKQGTYSCLTKSIKCNETGKVFSSIKECVKEMNLPKYSETKISQILLGKRKRKDVAGFTFSEPNVQAIKEVASL